MERGLASQLQAFFMATLLALAILSMVTLVPRMYVCLRNFMVSIPSTVSAIGTPKCLFVFSNIIVIFLANESKLSPRSGDDDTQYSMSTEDCINVARHQLLVAMTTPVNKEIIERDGLATTDDMAVTGQEEEQQQKEEEEDTMVGVHESLMQLHQVSDQLQDASSTIVVVEDLTENLEANDTSLANFGDHGDECIEGGEHLELGRIELREEVIDEEECEEEMGMPADELNRRVEEFIARFNMERQLEARTMLVCCF